MQDALCRLVHANVDFSGNQWLIIFHVIYLKHGNGRLSTFSQILKHLSCSNCVFFIINADR